MENKILVAEDSATTRASVKYVLTQAGYEIIVANDGADGLRKFEELAESGDDIVLIITDIQMPKSDGIRFMQAVKQGSYAAVPVLVLIKNSMKFCEPAARKAGAAGWLVKPFQPAQLLAVVKRLTE
ncbi:MAG: response regulator [Calditrichaeota bacterium]|nr:MAG: response regulator [Calditrichota bacterium]